MGLTYPHEHFESRVLSLAGSSRVNQGDLKHKKDSLYLCVLKTEGPMWEGPESSLQQCLAERQKENGDLKANTCKSLFSANTQPSQHPDTSHVTS